MTAQQMLDRANELERIGLRATAAVFRLAADRKDKEIKNGT